ncbi:MAG TPA: NAD(P)H-binding protein [Pseudonocardia sp.]|uniref:NmrA family NAD(P)-binding protein n=1 Tax=Pseudonocardia sp. TaxID=60912 RepID=UPI002CEEFAA7|nr:NAD(P)H-binding protein [Pseudonocardia sp.]HTF47934.1 NAD(P)H-binding protein [Pseudonocardia sp.]
MYLVTGSTGNVGAELVRALIEDGAPVRALTRVDTGKPTPNGVQLAVGDLNRPETLRDALAGVCGLFLLPGYQDMKGLLAEAASAGVHRVALLSGSSADGDQSNAITRYMSASEAAVHGSGLAWTVLRPSAFMSNTLEWVPQLRAGDLVRAPFAGVRAATVDPADIAAVAALALRDPAHAGQTYRLTGPEALLPADRVAVLAEVLGRPLRFAGQADDEARAELSASMPVEYVDAFFSFYVEGTLDESPVLPTVPELTGRPARTFREWAEAHAAELT